MKWRSVERALGASCLLVIAGAFAWFEVFDLGRPAQLQGQLQDVIDADSFHVQGQRVRLWGVDAPAGHTAEGQAATAFLLEAFGGRHLICEIQHWQEPTERYRVARAVARCRSGEADIGAALIASGHGKENRRYSGGYYAE